MRFIPTRRRSWAGAWLVMAVLISGACSDSGQGKAEKLPTARVDELKQGVAALARDIHQQVGAELGFKTNEPLDAPCENPDGTSAGDDGPFYVQGTYQITLPADQHRPVMQRLEDDWRAANWTGLTYRPFGTSGEAELKGTHPGDSTTVTLTSGKPPTIIRVLIITRCHQQQ